MVDVKKVEKTAENGGVQNVAPGVEDLSVSDTTARQAAATIPAAKAAAAVDVSSGVTEGKSFRDTVREREDARARGEPERNEAYPTPLRNVKPSKRTEAEASRGAEAQADAAYQQSDSPVLADVEASSDKKVKTPVHK